MICGALQTLNEDAFEDVASSERPSPSGMPTGEMIAAAAQLHLAPIRESSEFGSPSDEQKFNNNLLSYHVANNNNNNNNNYNPTPTPPPNTHHQHQSQQHKLSAAGDYNRSVSSHSLHSLSGGMQLGNGITNSSNSTGTVTSGGGGGGGINLVLSSNNLRHSLVGDGGGIGGMSSRHPSVGEDLLVGPLTPQLRSPSMSSGIPTVVVIPNENGGDSVTHHLVDDTKL